MGSIRECKWMYVVDEGKSEGRIGLDCAVKCGQAVLDVRATIHD